MVSFLFGLFPPPATILDLLPVAASYNTEARTAASRAALYYSTADRHSPPVITTSNDLPPPAAELFHTTTRLYLPRAHSTTGDRSLTLLRNNQLPVPVAILSLFAFGCRLWLTSAVVYRPLS